MKKIGTWLLLAAVLAGFGALPVRGTDVAELLPARLLTVEAEQGVFVLKTDNDAEGRGPTVELAMADLKRTAPGELFLSTVEHVVVTRNAWSQMPKLAVSDTLRPAAKLYFAEKTPDAAEAQAFLAAHPGELTLSRARALLLTGQSVVPPNLTEQDGRLHLGA